MRTALGLGRVSIIGTGQAGTMLGMALHGAPGIDRIALHDRDPEAAAAGLARGAGDDVVPRLETALDADAVVLAIPVPEVLEVLDRFGERFSPGTLVLDTASAKRVVVDAMRALPTRVHAVGGHPLAGTEVPGAAGADPSRLRGAAFVLSPVREDDEALERARALVEAAGARPLTLEAAAHDRAIARTSHLAHLVAFALAAVAGAEAQASRAVASTGYLGATRLAASDPSMVAGFLSANADEVRSAAEALRVALDVLVEAAGRGAPEIAAALGEAGEAWRATRP